MEMEMLLMKFESYLCDEEKSKSTINKYLHDVREMLDLDVYKRQVQYHIGCGLSGIWSPESSHRDFNGGCHGFHYRRRT